MKYVMFVKEEKGLKTFCPIIFPNVLSHSEIAETFLNDNPKFEVNSAGFINSFDIQKAFGNSETLKIDSHPLDSYRIQMNDYGGGFE
jgi:hypothetical protein